MLTNGFNHVAVLTSDTERFVRFYARGLRRRGAGPRRTWAGTGRLTFVKVGEQAEFNVFEVDGNTESERQTPMLGRGRLDHLALQAASLEDFEEARRRLMERGAADDFVTDFGPVLSMFFRDPDGLECEVCVDNPDAQPGVFNPPGTRAARYS